jgi:hypothetical protein
MWGLQEMAESRQFQFGVLCMIALAMAGLLGLGAGIGPVEWTTALGTSSRSAFRAVLVLRCAIATYFIGVLSWSWAQCNNCKWWIYLTDWSFFLETIYAVALVALTLSAAMEKRTPPKYLEADPSREPTIVRIFVVLFMVAVPISTLITLMYWTLIIPFWNLCVFRPGLGEETCLPLPDSLAFAEHLFNTPLLLLSFLSCRVPFYFRNAGWLILFGVAYSVWTVVYFYINPETPIYKTLDWRNPSATLEELSVVLLVVTPVLIVLMCLIGRGRDACFSFCHCLQISTLTDCTPPAQIKVDGQCASPSVFEPTVGV